MQADKNGFYMGNNTLHGYHLNSFGNSNHIKAIFNYIVIFSLSSIYLINLHNKSVMEPLPLHARFITRSYQIEHFIRRESFEVSRAFATLSR